MSSRGFGLAAFAVSLAAASPALAHHGFGLFKMDRFVDYSGTLSNSGHSIGHWQGDTGADVVLLSAMPFEKHVCAELTFEFTQPGR